MRFPLLRFVVALSFIPGALIAAAPIECARTVDIDQRRIQRADKMYAVPVPADLLRKTEAVELLDARGVVASRPVRSLGRTLHGCPPRRICFVPANGSDPRLTGGPLVLRTVRHLESRVAVFKPRTGTEIHSFKIRKGFKPVSMVWRNAGSIPFTLNVRDTKAVDSTTLDNILAGVIAPEMTDAEKAKAVFKYLTRQTYHWFTPNPFNDEDDDLHDLVRYLNVYGYGLCGDNARSFVMLARAAGLQARLWQLNGHVVAEAYYDGGWHMFDVDNRVFYKEDDGSIASVEQLSTDPTPILRASHDGSGTILSAIYTSTADNRVDDIHYGPSTETKPTLEPGDVVVFPYGDGTRSFTTQCDGTQPAPAIGNGTITRDVTTSFRVDGSEADLDFEWPFLLLDAEFRLKLTGLSDDIEVVLSEPNRERRTNVALREQSEGVVKLPFDFTCARRATYKIHVHLKSITGEPLASLITDASMKATFQFATRMLPRPSAHEITTTLAAAQGALAVVELSSVENGICSPRPAVPEEAAVVRIRSGGRIEPSRLFVKTGTAVHWQALEAGHDVAFSDGSASSGELDAGQEFTRVFDRPAVIHFYCKHRHSTDETGTIEVFRPVTGDFDLDGKSDLLWWRREGGLLAIWHPEDGFFRNEFVMESATGPEWTLDCLGDVNGDGYTDLIWRNEKTGAVHVWLMRQNAYIGTLVIREFVPVGWRAKSIVDVEGDNRTDLLIENTRAPGQFVLWRLNAGCVKGTERIAIDVGGSGSVVGFADVESDGGLDAVIWDASTREVSYRTVGGSVSPSHPIGSVPNSDWIPVAVADVDGDGDVDLIWRNNVTGRVNVWFLRKGAFARTTSLGHAEIAGWQLIAP